jgi:CO/xanthine dehydrogenase Mo-binding subunit
MPRIDLSGAKAVSGVVAAFSVADLADVPEIRRLGAPAMLRRVVATDAVRYVGQPVARFCRDFGSECLP